MSDDVHKMSPQRYFLNVYLVTYGIKWIHDFAVLSGLNRNDDFDNYRHCFGNDDRF